MQQERRIGTVRHNRTDAVSHLPDDGERRYSLEVKLLLGGCCFPGVIEYHANDDRITFTLKRSPSSTLMSLEHDVESTSRP